MGDNIYLGDRNGVRTPMQWSADRNAGFSRANPQRLYLPVDHRPRVPLRERQRRGAAAQPALAAVVDEAAASRCASATRRSAAARSSSCTPTNRKVLAFVRRLRGRAASWSSPTCRASSSTSSSTCRAFTRRRCRSSCSARRRFPPIGELPYLLTLGPHAFYWFAHRAADVTEDADDVGFPGDRGVRLDRRRCVTRPPAGRAGARDRPLPAGPPVVRGQGPGDPQRRGRRRPAARRRAQLAGARAS